MMKRGVWLLPVLIAFGSTTCAPAQRAFGTGGGDPGGGSSDDTSSSTSSGGGNGGQGGGIDLPACDPGEKPEASTGVFVSKLAGSEVGDGSAAAPVKTITAAIVIAKTSGKTTVYVSPGVYEESVVLSPGLTVRGGWLIDANFDWSHSCAADAPSKVNIVASGVEAPVVTLEGAAADEQNAPVMLQTLTVSTAGDVLETSPATEGRSLTGILARGGAQVTLERVRIKTHAAGNGGPAESGLAGLSALKSCSTYKCTTGLAGATGATPSPAALGTFDSNGQFIPANGAVGGNGGIGATGTPGGEAACFSQCIVGCSSSCTPIYGSGTCSTAGRCGCGGGGGTAGGAGRGGGAAVALIAAGATTQVTVRASELTPGKGGDASPGGDGGQGGIGSAGVEGQASGLCNVSPKTCLSLIFNCSFNPSGIQYPGGVAGGDGGPGGPGAKGSSGAGGPSFAVVKVAGASVTIDNSALTVSAGGKGEPAGAAEEVFEAP
jgi:hypothetical protein